VKNHILTYWWFYAAIATLIAITRPGFSFLSAHKESIISHLYWAPLIPILIVAGLSMLYWMILAGRALRGLLAEVVLHTAEKLLGSPRLNYWARHSKYSRETMRRKCKSY
jgi:hypothetical protein